MKKKFCNKVILSYIEELSNCNYEDFLELANLSTRYDESISLYISCDFCIQIHFFDVSSYIPQELRLSQYNVSKNMLNHMVRFFEEQVILVKLECIESVFNDLFEIDNLNEKITELKKYPNWIDATEILKAMGR